MFAEFFIISTPTKNPRFIHDVAVFTSDKLSLCHSVGQYRFRFVVYLCVLADHEAAIKEFSGFSSGSSLLTPLLGCLDIKWYRNGNSGTLVTREGGDDKLLNEKICCSKLSTAWFKVSAGCSNSSHASEKPSFIARANHFQLTFGV